MKKILKFIWWLILWIWQLPQNIVGLVFLLFVRDKQLIRRIGFVRVYSSPNMQGGISLGHYIIIHSRHIHDETTINHEYGHCKQSRMLGWSYLIVIGLPSVIHAALCKNNNYYHFYTERWADKLMNIKRNFKIK